MDDESREALLRPYAEAKCPECKGKGRDEVDFGCRVCGGALTASGTGLDPRFDALRGEHRLGLEACCVWCRLDWGECGDGGRPYCLRTDLGSIVRAAAACGLYLEITYNKGYADGEWAVRMTGDYFSYSDVIEEAAARAFVAAVPLP